MGKLKKAALSILMIFTCSIFAGYETKEEEEQKGQALCEFAESFFQILHAKDQNEGELVRRLRPFATDVDPTIQQIVSRLIQGLEQDELDSQEAKGEAVSHLGRLIKCSVDTATHHLPTTYLLHKQDLMAKTQAMEIILAADLPEKGTNFHKLMIESLAEKRYDLALYAYLKIAEERCQD